MSSQNETHTSKSSFKVVMILIGVIFAGIIVTLITGVSARRRLSDELKAVQDSVVMVREQIGEDLARLEEVNQDIARQDSIEAARSRKEAQTASQFNQLLRQLKGITIKYDAALNNIVNSGWENDWYEKASRLYDEGLGIIRKIEKIESSLTPEQATEFDKARSKFENMGNGILYG